MKTHLHTVYTVHEYNRNVISRAWRGGIFHVLTFHCPVNENRSKVKKSGKHPFFRRLQHKSQQKCTQICIFLYFLKLRLLKVIRLSKTSFWSCQSFMNALTPLQISDFYHYCLNKIAKRSKNMWWDVGISELRLGLSYPDSYLVNNMWVFMWSTHSYLYFITRNQLPSAVFF